MGACISTSTDPISNNAIHVHGNDPEQVNHVIPDYCLYPTVSPSKETTR